MKYSSLVFHRSHLDNFHYKCMTLLSFTDYKYKTLINKVLLWEYKFPLAFVCFQPWLHQCHILTMVLYSDITFLRMWLNIEIHSSWSCRLICLVLFSQILQIKQQTCVTLSREHYTTQIICVISLQIPGTHNSTPQKIIVCDTWNRENICIWKCWHYTVLSVQTDLHFLAFPFQY